jgi:uncharacterized protein
MMEAGTDRTSPGALRTAPHVGSRMNTAPIPSPLSDKSDRLQGLCRRCGVQRLELFGSAATSAFDPARSDFDFLVEFEALPEGHRANAYFGLREGLIELYGRPVDLVMVRAVHNPYFLANIASSRVLLYAA